MRAILVSSLFGVAAAACSSSPSPRLIAGGGIGDGSIDGTANVYAIDAITDQPITGATVEIGGKDVQTDKTGLAVFGGVNGPQTVVVQAAGYRGEVWQDANGTNMTVPLTQLGTLTPQQATLSGTITGYPVTVAAGHAAEAVVAYSQTDELTDSIDNNIPTPANGNICIGPNPCNWTLASRTGQVTITAAILDRDLNGTPTDLTDDTTTIVGYATSGELQVNAGVAQSGLALAQLAAGSLQSVTIADGTLPSPLTEETSVVGVELAGGEVVQLPTFAQTDQTAPILVPTPAAFAPGATYRLSAIGETQAGDAGAQSAVLVRGQTQTALAVATWLAPPAGVTASHASCAMAAVTGALIHSMQWSDATGVILEITMFDAANTSATIPALVAPASSDALTAKAQAIAADIDLQDFSLETDQDKIWGVSNAPVTVD